MRFEDVIGQAPLIERLKSLVDQNRLSHAILLIGREGNGGLPLALALSTYIMEQADARKQVPAEAGLFGETIPAQPTISAASRKAAEYLHPDIHYSIPVHKRHSGTDSPSRSDDWINEWRAFLKEQPYGNLFDWLEYTGADNKQGKISAAECTDISRKLHLKSFEGSCKILVQWLPELMGQEGNKLLKLIEEPPPDTIFILVTENEELLLPTILSRCQSIRIPPVETAAIASSLENLSAQSPETALQIAQISEGNYREALRLIKETDQDWQGEIRNWLNMILQNKLVEQVKWCDKVYSQGREYQKQLLRRFLHLIELSTRMYAMGDENMNAAGTEQDFAKRMNKICRIEQLEVIAKEIDKAIYYIERNANGKMLFMALTIKLIHIIKENTLPVLEANG